MSKYPDRFVIPEDRIPRPWSQGLYKCCGMASVVKVLEVINYVKTGKYTMLSKGYAYGRHSNPVYKTFKVDVGIDYDYTMKSLLVRGTVPEEMYPKMNELPDIIDDVANHPNIAELDKEAEKTKIKSFTKIEGNAYFRDNVKKYLYEKQLPLVANVVGYPHCVVIVGWDGKEYLCHDHDGSDRIVRLKCNFAYAFDGGIDDKKEEDDMPEMNFIDVSENRWSYDAIKTVVEEGIMKGTSPNVFEPSKALTREEAATIISRLISKYKDK